VEHNKSWLLEEHIACVVLWEWNRSKKEDYCNNEMVGTCKCNGRSICVLSSISVCVLVCERVCVRVQLYSVHVCVLCHCACVLGIRTCFFEDQLRACVRIHWIRTNWNRRTMHLNKSYMIWFYTYNSQTYCMDFRRRVTRDADKELSYVRERSLQPRW